MASLVNSDSAYRFTPTTNAKWTTVKTSFGFVTRGLYNNLLFPILEKVVKPKVDPDAWEKIKAIKLEAITTVGDIEVIALEIFEVTIKADDNRKKEVHEQLRGCLQIYAEKGLAHTIAPIKEFINNV